MNYSPLEDKSDLYSQPSEDYEALLSESRTSHKPPFQRKYVLLSAILIPIVSIILLGLGAWVGSRWLANANDICPNHIQHYCEFLRITNLNLNPISFIAPILKEVDTTLYTAHFNGSFLKKNVFRQDAGPEVDAAWASLGVHCEISCQMAQIVTQGSQMHRSKPSGAKIRSSQDRFEARPSPNQRKVRRRLSCQCGRPPPPALPGEQSRTNFRTSTNCSPQNLVRQSLYYNIDYYKAKGEGAFTNDDNIVKYHVCQ